MRVFPDWDNIQPAGDIERLPAGGYVIVIRNVEDEESNERLKIEYDIAEGDYRGYYQERYDMYGGWWSGSFYRSYSLKAASFFKSFINAVEASNGQWRWNPQRPEPQTLVGRKVGVVFQEREYIKRQGANKGKVGTILDARTFLPAEKIRRGEFKPYPKQGLSEADRLRANAPTGSSGFGMNEDDIQF